MKLYLVSLFLTVGAFAFDSSVCSHSVHFKYNSKGLCNFFIQFRSLLIGAKHLKKKVCGKSGLVKDGGTTQRVFTENITDFFDMSVLEKVIKFEDENICAQCYALYNKHTPLVPFFWPPATKTHDVTMVHFNLSETIHMNAKYLKISKPINPVILHMTRMVGVFEDVKEEYIPLVQHLRPPQEIEAAAIAVQTRMFNYSSPVSESSSFSAAVSENEQHHQQQQQQPPPYACMHWRFEETKCGWKNKNKSPLGLCLVSSEKDPCDTHGRCASTPGAQPRAFVRIYTADNMIDAVSQTLQRNNISNLFLITDGHLRNQSHIVDFFSKPFGSSLKTIANSVTPNELDEIMQPIRLNNTFSKFAALERKVCANADMVIGSAISSFAWEIFFDHAKDDTTILEAVLNNQVHHRAAHDTPNRTWTVDPGYRSADYNDPILRNWSMGYLPDLRPETEKRSNIYFLDTLVARFVEKKAIVEKKPKLVQKMFTVK
jgi:hypothetical protein